MRHNCIGHNYIRHNYVRHDYIGLCVVCLSAANRRERSRAAQRSFRSRRSRSSIVGHKYRRSHRYCTLLMPPVPTSSHTYIPLSRRCGTLLMPTAISHNYIQLSGGWRTVLMPPVTTISHNYVALPRRCCALLMPPVDKGPLCR